MKNRVTELINQIESNLNSPESAEKVLTECGKEILEIVEKLEQQSKTPKSLYKVNTTLIKRDERSSTIMSFDKEIAASNKNQACYFMRESLKNFVTNDVIIEAEVLEE